MRKLWSNFVFWMFRKGWINEIVIISEDDDLI